jgi:AmmeMemoRadiSam system protein B
MVPKLRPVESRWVEHHGQPMLLLRDPLRLTDQILLLPPTASVVLSLIDGQRDLAAIRAAFQLRTGMTLSLSALEDLVAKLDEALLLETPRYYAARQAALTAFRTAPYRPPALAGETYPADPEELEALLERFIEQAGASAHVGAPVAAWRGVISPHIDYARGWAVYARTWQAASAAVAEAETVVIFGTDHAGSPGSLTPTRQRYATPWGALETDCAAVNALAEALSEERAFAEELHHRYEHSIELALVWLHFWLRRAGRDGSCRIVPILCGSFHPYTQGERCATQEPTFEQAAAALRDATAGRRTLVVAAADLCHVGPEFGDIQPLGPVEKILLKQHDMAVLETICSGDADAFLAPLVEEQDRRRVCGLPPIYMTLRLLGSSRGEVVAYDQCPAGAGNGSVVSIAGVLLR